MGTKWSHPFRMIPSNKLRNRKQEWSSIISTMGQILIWCKSIEALPIYSHWEYGPNGSGTWSWKCWVPSNPMAGLNCKMPFIDAQRLSYDLASRQVNHLIFLPYPGPRWMWLAAMTAAPVGSHTLQGQDACHRGSVTWLQHVSLDRELHTCNILSVVLS